MTSKPYRRAFRGLFEDTNFSPGGKAMLPAVLLYSRSSVESSFAGKLQTRPSHIRFEIPCFSISVSFAVCIEAFEEAKPKSQLSELNETLSEL